MKLIDRPKPKTPPVQPGVYMAVWVGVADLGEQYSEKFKNDSNKVKFVRALPAETLRIYLLHLSDASSHEGNFINKVARAVPRGIKSTACRK